MPAALIIRGVLSDRYRTLIDARGERNGRGPGGVVPALPLTTTLGSNCMSVRGLLFEIRLFHP
jgi:hypothetical protein